MFRYILTSVFLLVALAGATSQEELYYQALKAEEAEDIPRALSLFKAAVAEPGPYTEEIQEIIDDYQDALATSSWEFHTSGDASFVGLHYKRNTATKNEFGSEITSTINASAEYETTNWSHAFEINLSGNWFTDKDDMPSLDTSAWEASFGVEYELAGKTFALDAGTNLNISEVNDLTPEFYLWTEKYLIQLDRHKFGTSLWGYYNTDGPLQTAAYLTWHRYAPYGWRSSVFAGARFEADSISMRYWLKWLGPSFNPTFSFRFRTGISIGAKASLFYGFIIDSPDQDYNHIKKFSASWGCNFSWKPNIFGVFIGMDQFYRAYIVPKRKKNREFTDTKRIIFSQLKAGVSWDI